MTSVNFSQKAVSVRNWAPDSWCSVDSRRAVGCRPGELPGRVSQQMRMSPNRSPAGIALQEKGNQVPAVSARPIFSQLYQP